MKRKTPYWKQLVKYYLYFWVTFKIKDGHLWLRCPPYFVCWDDLSKQRLFGRILFKKIL